MTCKKCGCLMRKTRTYTKNGKIISVYTCDKCGGWGEQ